MEVEQDLSQELEAANKRGKGVGRAESRKRRDGKLANREGDSIKKKRGRSDIEIDRRIFNGHTVVLLEDRSMMKPDGTSKQYIIAVETISKSGGVSLVHKCYISDLAKRQGYANAYEAARANFLNPEKFRGSMGEHWLGYQSRKFSEYERDKWVSADQLPLFGS